MNCRRQLSLGSELARVSHDGPRASISHAPPSTLALALLVFAVVGFPATIRGQATVLEKDRPRILGPLSVNDAVSVALRENLEVQATRFEADAASEERRAARSMTRPQVSANTYFSSGDMPNILGTAPGLSPASFMTVPSKRFVDQNLTLMVPLYTGGKLGNLAKAASHRESAARAGVGGAEAEAALMVKEAYYQALLATEMAKVAEARLNASSAMVSLMRAQFEAGKGIQASVTRADAELADARRMLASAQNDRAKMLLDLKLAMGVPLDAEVELTDSLGITTPPADLAANLAESSNRPELVVARARVDAAIAQAGAARGSYKPQIYGAAMADAFWQRDMNDHIGGTLGVIVSFPLMDAGQRTAEARQMEAMRRRSEAELREMELRVAAEVRKARLDIETAAANNTAAEAVVQSLEAAYEVVVLRVASEKSIVVEQLDALAALTQARANREQARFDHSIAVARLLRAIGRY